MQIKGSIKTALSEGKTTEEIYKNLMNSGYTVDQIQELFSEISVKKEEVDVQQHGIRIVLIIAAILVGLGVLSFFATNWESIPRIVKVLLIIISMCASYLAGWYFRTVVFMAKTSDALILLGTIIYGAGVFLITRMYGVKITAVDQASLWMLGALVTAYALDRKLIYIFSIAIGLFAVFFATFQSYDFDDPSGRSVMVSSLILTITTVTLFYSAIMLRRKSLQNRGGINSETGVV